MSIPSSWQNLTGMRAVGAAVVIVGLIGLKVWNKTPHYRSFDSGTWEIPAGESMVYQLTAKDDTKLRVEVDSDPPTELTVYMLDAANHQRLMTQNSDQQTPSPISSIFERSSRDRILVEDVSLSSGEYTMITENPGSTPAKVRFKLSEYR